MSSTVSARHSGETPGLAASMSGAAPVPVSGAVLEIDLGALCDNWRLQRSRVGSHVECAAVVKGNAFGCGLIDVSRALAAEGCRTFFVATVDEALDLRAALPDGRIVALNGLLGAGQDLERNRIVPVLSDPADIAEWQAVARRMGRKLDAFLQVDTGLNRLGLSDQDFAAFTGNRPDAVAVAALMSHLACSSDPQAAMNDVQRLRFEEKLRAMRAAGNTICGSLADSGGILLGPHFHFDLVRPGVSLFGGSNDPGRAGELLAGIRQVTSLKARAVQVREVLPPQTIGYSAGYRVTRPMRIAVASIGFADGLPRFLGAAAQGFLDGFRAPIIGNLSMDLTIFDVTDVPANAVFPGAWIELFGPAHPVDRFAAEAGTVPDEILSRLGRRVARRYVGRN